MTISSFLLLLGGGFCAGFVDSIAGGGGLIALPLLLSLGLPPQTALGTNKLQGSFGTFSSSLNYIRKGKVRLQENYTGIIFTFIGAALGTWTIQQIEPAFLEYAIPVLLFGIFIYTLLTPKLGYKEQSAKLSLPIFFAIFGIGLGFYDGFFGPGTGSFWMAALVIVGGFTMTKAAGTTRIMNFVSNIIALTLFALGGNIVYSAGLVMALGQLLGATVGSNLAIKNGARIIRPIFLTVVFLTLVKLLYSTLMA